MTVRVAYNLFTQRPGQELDDFSKWVKTTRPGDGDDFYRMNGAGEMLTFSAADFEDFLEPRPDLAGTLEQELTPVVRLLAQNRWPFRLHATYDESISRFLDVFEAVNREVPFDGLRWFFDHAETVTRAQPGADQGAGRRHRGAAPHGLPGRVLHRPLRPGGRRAHARRSRRCWKWASRSARAPTPRAWRATTRGCRCTGWPRARRSAARRSTPRRTGWTGSRRCGATRWAAPGSPGEEDKKGAVVAGQLADLAVLSADYFSVPEEEIKGIESVLTLVGGKVVYGAGEFAGLAPPPLPVLPDWSPVRAYGGYYPRREATEVGAAPSKQHALLHRLLDKLAKPKGGPLWGLGCDCFVF